MKIVLRHQGQSYRVTTPYEGSDHAIAETACPHCSDQPLYLAGTGRRIAPDDRAYEADAVCLKCRGRVGIVRAEPSTLFGLREDEAVLYGRARVY